MTERLPFQYRDVLAGRAAAHQKGILRRRVVSVARADGTECKDDFEIAGVRLLLLVLRCRSREEDGSIGFRCLLVPGIIAPCKRGG